MASEVFVDSGGYFSLLNPRDELHAEVKRVVQRLEESKVRFVTTDYVLDETATLLSARKFGHVVGPWLEMVVARRSDRIVWMDPDRFDFVRHYFARHADKAWSFTDCFSFCVMKERKIRRALAADIHFRQAGFHPLLAS